MYLIILFIIVAIATGLFYVNSRKAGPKRTYKENLSGKIVIITGCSAGIGKETARKLASHNATIFFACRSQSKTQPIIDQIQQQTKNKDLHFIQVDLSDYDSVRQFVIEFRKKFQKIDILINNAGAFKNSLELNKWGHEMSMAANHLGHYLLTTQLLDLFTDKSRIINVSSEAHKMVKKPVDWQAAIYSKQAGFMAYGQSKLANILFSQALQEQFDKEGRNVKVVSLHPGGVSSEIYSQKNFSKWLSHLLSVAQVLLKFVFLTEAEGAWTSIYAALQSYEELVPCGYYEKNALSQATKFARTCGQEQSLMEASEQAVNSKKVQ